MMLITLHRLREMPALNQQSPVYVVCLPKLLLHQCVISDLCKTLRSCKSNTHCTVVVVVVVVVYDQSEG